MLDYGEYGKIINFLDHKEYDRLREFVTNEYKVKCFEEARNTLNKYLTNNHDIYYGYVDSGNVWLNQI